ncbi:MAG: hypothetical protein RML33_02750 [Acidobacteriota bacterium]|nr:hypothetical protein [Pyrinomonadaceae bacterium]MDW8303739.1 hypothetical protein [Acidobacteriota bacterium]
MAESNQEKINQESFMIRQYLIEYFRKRLKDEVATKALEKIEEKIAKKLGLETYVNILLGNLPGSSLSKFTVFYLKVLFFEAYFTVNPDINPYDPIKQQDQYVEYLLYTWARGRPAYRHSTY